jgi:hypothetical protein
MNKHKFNIFPEAKAEDYNRLRDDILENGYDKKRPVTLYQGDVLDGWNRQRACDEIGICPSYEQFVGDDSAAVAFVMRTNKRRNLNSGQWATVAVEAEAVMEAIKAMVEKEASAKRSAATTAQNLGGGQNCPPPKQDTPNHTAPKLASAFNTSATYVKQATKIKAAAPEMFEKVKSGHMTMQDAAKAVRAIPTNPWLPDEEERKAQVLAGRTVVANAERCKNLIQWAESKGLAVRVDRGTDFGNPFILGPDGTRDEVCDKYRDHYLPFKPSIQKQRLALVGKVLICHCYPERCHGMDLEK